MMQRANPRPVANDNRQITSLLQKYGCANADCQSIYGKLSLVRYPITNILLLV